MTTGTTSYAYRALSIKERQTLAASSFEADLSLAIPYWSELLGLRDRTELALLLNQRYQADLDDVSVRFDRHEADAPDELLEWVLYIDDVFTNQSGARSEEGDDYETIAIRSFPFYTFFEPFLRDFYYSLFYDLLPEQRNQIERGAKNDILQYYLDQLYTIAHKTLMLEMNCLRTEGKLSGNTSEERYESYVELYLQKMEYRSALVQEYPVLFRLLADKTVYMKRFIHEVIERSFADFGRLSLQFGITDCMVQRLELGQGDSHQEGRAVAIVQYGCGSRLVYKPRSMQTDAVFQQFVGWMNEGMDDEVPLMPVEVLDCGSYGWMQFVRHEPCAARSQLEKFYYRLGKLLAVLHTLNATDFHYENIIAYGEQPVLIDLESLFHHPLTGDHDMTGSGAINQALMLIRDSVLSTGVIPVIVDKRQPFDISGIGGRGEQLSPFKISSVEGAYTDEMRLAKRYGTLSAGRNTPFGEGATEEEGIVTYLDDICRGFAAAYTFFMSRAELLKLQLNRFAPCEIRKIMTSTMKYAKLLQLSYHPDFMRNQLDRELLLNRIARITDTDASVAGAEIEDLLGGDIPYFCTVPSSRDLMDSRRRVTAGLYYAGGLDRCLAKLDGLSAADLEHQLAIIRSTISAMYTDEDVNLSGVKLRETETEAEVNQGANLVLVAEGIADTLLASAIKHSAPDGDEMCWTSMVTKGGSETAWQYSITGPGLYDGNPGIAMFFAYLWKVTGDEKYRRACRAAMLPIELVLEQFIEPDHINIGAFLGLGGLAYSFYSLGRCLDEPVYRSTGIRLLKEMPRVLHNDRLYDMIGGSAGALVVLTRVLECEDDQAELRRIGDQLASHLLANAKEQTVGVAWCPGAEEAAPYIGFSHGNAGIIYALSLYAPYSERKEEIEWIVREAMAYENTKFDHSVGNWFNKHLDHHSLSWCHGAPGILLSRIAVLRQFPSAAAIAQDDIRAALAATLSAPAGSNLSFCHGALGNADLLHIAAASLGSAGQCDVEAIDRYETELIARLVEQSGSMRADVNAVGVMNGLASIGYGLLRLHDRSRVPSLLALEMV